MGDFINVSLWLQEIMTDPVIADVRTLCHLLLLASACPKKFTMSVQAPIVFA